MGKLNKVWKKVIISVFKVISISLIVIKISRLEEKFVIGYLQIFTIMDPTLNTM